MPSAGEITWTTADGLLMASAVGGTPRCLARVEPSSDLEWGGDADRVLVEDAVLTAAGSRRLPDEGAGSFSRPKGTSVLEYGEGQLAKFAVADGKRTDVGFLTNYQSATYHPAGRHIVAAGDGPRGPGIYIADNLGHDPQVLVSDEHALQVTQLAFANSGALHFIARHDDRSHLHRFDLATGELTTVAEGPRDSLFSLVVAPVTGGGVAWNSDGGCDEDTQLHAVRGGKEVPLKGTVLEHGHAIGFLPDGTFVAFKGDGPGCDRNPMDIYAIRGTAVTLIAKEAINAAVRARHAPPAAAPTRIESRTPG